MFWFIEIILFLFFFYFGMLCFLKKKFFFAVPLAFQFRSINDFNAKITETRFDGIRKTKVQTGLFIYI